MFYHRIAVQDAHELITTVTPVVVDIRDEASFRRGHICEAVHLDNDTAQGFIEQADKQHPVLIYCYHGNSSQAAAQYLVEQGFASVYSLDGGFMAWQASYPERVEQA